MKEWYQDFIGVYEQAISPEWCEKLINLINSLPLNSREPNEGDGLQKKDKHNFLSNFNKPLTIEFSNFLEDTIIPLYYSKYDIFRGVGPYNFEGFKVQKTLPTEGYHVWHSENTTVGESLRIASYTLYLNNVEEGGETEFLYQSLRIKPTQGTIIFFPSAYTHVHRGNPPLSGPKYIMTGGLVYKTN